MAEGNTPVTDVAVVMNYYSGFEFMRESLESLTMQDCDFTLYILDNASDVSPVALLDEFRKSLRIKYSRLSSHVQLYEARNIAIDLVEERFVAFLDVDDLWKPNKLSTQARYMMDGQYALTFTGFNTFSRDSNIHRNVPLPRRYRCPVTPKELSKKYVVAMSSVMVDKQVLKRLGGFDSKFEIIGDYDLVLRVAEYGRVCFLQDELVSIRIHDQSTGHLARKLQMKEFESWKRKSLDHFIDSDLINKYVDQEISVLAYVSSAGLNLPLFFRTLRASGTVTRRLSILRTLFLKILKK